MARRQLGLDPQRPDDEVTFGFMTDLYPVNSHYVEISSDYNIFLPNDPVDHQMELFEIFAIEGAVVNVPLGTLFTFGTGSVVAVGGGKTAFLGFRYSSHAHAWFLLSLAVQN